MTEQERIKKVEDSKEEFFYIQDNREYTEHPVTKDRAMMWFGKFTNCYFSNLSSARKYTKKEVIEGFPWENTHVIWPESEALEEEKSQAKSTSTYSEKDMDNAYDKGYKDATERMNNPNMTDKQIECDHEWKTVRSGHCRDCVKCRKGE